MLFEIAVVENMCEINNLLCVLNAQDMFWNIEFELYVELRFTSWKLCMQKNDKYPRKTGRNLRLPV